MPMTHDDNNPQIHIKVRREVYDGILARAAELGESKTVATRSLLLEALRARGLVKV